jgi:ribokinase
VLYNAAPAKPLGSSLAAVGPTVIVNEIEATQLSGVGDPGEAASVLAHLYGSAVVTRGGDGVSWVNDDQHMSSPAIAISVVDTTGAGDAFCGAFAAARAAGEDFSGAIDRGNVAGASAASSAGARGWAK